MKRMEGGICFKEAVPWDLSPSLPIRTCIQRRGGCPPCWRRRPKAPKDWKVNSRQAAGQRPVPWGWNAAVYSHTPPDSATVLLVFAPWVRVCYYPINTNPTGKLKEEVRHPSTAWSFAVAESQGSGSLLEHLFTMWDSTSSLGTCEVLNNWGQTRKLPTHQ